MQQLKIIAMKGNLVIFHNNKEEIFLFLAVILCNNILRKIYIIGVEVLGTNVSIKPGSTSYYVALGKLV